MSLEDTSSKKVLLVNKGIATVLSIKDNRVTYKILSSIKLTEKEPKKCAFTIQQQSIQENLIKFERGEFTKQVDTSFPRV